METRQNMINPRYPIGKFDPPDLPASAEQRAAWIEAIRVCPSRLRAAVDDLNDARLDTPYRDGGWTVRQVVHHVPDSHMNSYVRFKLALTEEQPTIRGYEQDRWVLLPDTAKTPIPVSLNLLDALHTRWAVLLENMTGADYARTFVHPEMPGGSPIRLDLALAYYAWHGQHHTTHITALREKMGW